MFTVSVDSIALMPCNPNVGGSSKGHLVRELDALGGEMGKNIDKTFIQSKMLNQSKGPAVHSLRAQADKQAYSTEMRKTLENTENLTIRQGEVTELLVEDGHITGVKTFSGATYHAKAVVLCTGTYLKARCIYGDVSNYTGPNGLQAANYLTDSLKKLGIEMFRFKTGTPARIAGNTIDYSKMEEQFGDERVVPFSFSTDPEAVPEQMPATAPWRIIIIEDVDRMLERTTNVLLKEIEEPAEHCIWLLCAPSAQDVLPTIRSRTRIVNLAVPSTQAVAGFLTSTTNVEPKVAQRAARLAEGHIGIAKLYATDERVMSDRDELVVGVLNLARASDAVLLAGNLIDNAKAQAEADANRITAGQEAEFRRINGLAPSDRTHIHRLMMLVSSHNPISSHIRLYPG